MQASNESSRQQLIADNAILRQQVAALEAEVATLRQRQQLLQAIFDATTDAVFVKDLERRYILVNPAFAALLKTSTQDIVGKDDIALFPPDMAHHLYMADQRVRVTGETYTFEEVGTSTGTTRVYSSTKGAWRDAHGTIAGVIGIARDITAQKRAEDALRESEERYRRLVDLSPDAIMVSREGAIIFVNRTGVSLLGASSLNDLIGRPLLDIVRPASHAHASPCLQNFQEGRRSEPMEATVVRLDGQLIDVEVADVAIRYHHQPAVQTVVRDITARKRNDALQAGRARVLEMIAKDAPLAETLTALVALIEGQMPDMLGSILLLDEDGTHLRHGAAPHLPHVYTQAVDGITIGPGAGSCGTAAYRGAAVIVTDIAQDPLWDDFRALALPHGLRACWSTPIMASTGAVLGTFAMYYHEPRQPTDDALHLIELSTHVAGIAIERARAETALRVSEERFRHLIEGSIQGILVTSTSGTCLFVNQALATMYGYAQTADLIGQSFLETLVAPHERTRLLRYRDARLRGEEVPTRYEYEAYKQDGTVFWVETMVSLVPWGGETAILSTCVDMTERKRAEETIRRTQRLAAMGTMAAGIAHEINNPIGMILLAADNACDYPLERDVFQFLQTIISQSERCKRIVRSILRFARQESVDKRPCDLNATIRRAVDLTRAYAAQHQVHLELELAEGLPVVHLDTTAIEHVFMNLLCNAIEADARTICAHTIATSRRIRCRVCDDGHGLSGEERQHLFDPFFTTRRQVGGTGLGLSMIYGIIQEHGGEIDVQSYPGVGTTITIDFSV